MSPVISQAGPIDHHFAEAKIHLAYLGALQQVEGMTPAEKAHALREAIPPSGLFAGRTWRIAPDPLPLASNLYEEILVLGPRLHAFYKACNLLYRQSVLGKEPSWIHRYLDLGKPPSLLEASQDPGFKNDLPCVIRPDLLLTEDGFTITELDSVPGGIGLTAWLQCAYAQIANDKLQISQSQVRIPPMLAGFLAALKSEIQNPKSKIPTIAIVVSEEARDYRLEMEWLASENPKLTVCSPEKLEYRAEGAFLQGEQVDVVYRFFELFDLPNIADVGKLIAAARAGQVQVTPPFKPQLEEKLWFALFWFPQLAEFWRCELGDRFFRDLKKMVPFTWLLDPSPLPPHAVIPHLDIHDWRQLADFSQKQRDLILKVSGFSEHSWGSRGVYLGSDMPGDEWKKVVLRALDEFEVHPHILQPFVKTRLVEHAWYDFEKETVVPMKGRLRLCPYYFVENDKANLSGILATLCPADKKFIHGMHDAIMTLAVPADDSPP